MAKPSKGRSPRNRCRPRETDERVLRLLGEHYHELRRRLWKALGARYPMTDYEDTLHDTIIEAAADKRLWNLPLDKLLDAFCRKFNMVAYQNIHDNRQQYAIYPQKTEEAEDDPDDR